MHVALLRMVRAWIGRLRRLPERWLHSRRRSMALAALAAGARPERFLVLCYGNICRSPYAARLLRRELARRNLPGQVREGGFFGPDRPEPFAVLHALADDGF